MCGSYTGVARMGNSAPTTAACAPAAGGTRGCFFGTSRAAGSANPSRARAKATNTARQQRQPRPLGRRRRRSPPAQVHGGFFPRFLGLREPLVAGRRFYSSGRRRARLRRRSRDERVLVVVDGRDAAAQRRREVVEDLAARARRHCRCARTLGELGVVPHAVKRARAAVGR